MRNKPVLLYFIITLICYLLYSVFIAGRVPVDPAFVLFILFSLYIGPFYGTILGFLCGLSIDTLSISPLGFHSAVFVAIGYLYGKFKGKIFVDPVIVPVLLVIIAYFLKAALGYLTLLIVSDSQSHQFFFSDFWTKMFFSSLASPFIYLILKAINIIDLNEKD